MEEKVLNEILQKQVDFFNSGATFDYSFRKAQLEKLYRIIKENEKEIAVALFEDLGKSEIESYMCETGLVLSEISFMKKNLKKLMAKKNVKTPLAQFSAKSYRLPTPYGNTLIMSPWNYPFLLTIDPLVDAISAGNTVIIKPSAYSPSTSKLVKKLIEENFDKQFIAVVEGGRAENTALLQKKFDLVFFTGSQNVGKEVLRKCAENLTPAVLELGGKSPCIVDESADIKLSAKRIVFGKFLNCGQTCVAPDYILCSKKIEKQFIEAVKDEIKLQFGENPLENKNYGKIVNKKHFERICGLIDNKKVVYGGKIDENKQKIEPTILTATFEDAVMQEEIFGPLMPIITFDNFDEIFEILKDRQKPLALYIFSKDKKHIEKITTRVRFGGGCVNDVVIHLATTEMGFGGVGESGMGTYHGKVGFEAFSHFKSIVNKKTWIDLPMRYQPYTKSKEKTIKKFLK